MDRSEAKRIIREEDLRRWLWYVKPNKDVECMAIYEDDDEWVVVSTGERAEERGPQRFSNESDALCRFVDRLRALNRNLRRPYGLTVRLGSPWTNQFYRSGADIDRVSP